MDRSRRSEKLDGFPDCGEGWPGGSRGATRGEIRGETLGGPAVERSPPGEGGGGAVGGPDASIDRIDRSRRNDWAWRKGGAGLVASSVAVGGGTLGLDGR